MRRRPLLALLLTALLTPTLWADDAQVHGLDVATLAQCEAKVEAALKAYNDNDGKAFFQEFARKFESTAKPEVFESHYNQSVRPKFGAYESRKLMPTRSLFGPPVGLLFYEAKFAKREAFISANFYQEDGQWKLQQIRIER